MSQFLPSWNGDDNSTTSWELPATTGKAFTAVLDAGQELQKHCPLLRFPCKPGGGGISALELTGQSPCNDAPSPRGVARYWRQGFSCLLVLVLLEEEAGVLDTPLVMQLYSLSV